MHIEFAKWFQKNIGLFQNNGIETEFVRHSKTDNPGATYEQISSYCLGQISVWESGCMDMEILRKDSGETLLYTHHDFDKTPDFGKIVEDYLRIMRTGKA
jgi:hypothetical protein